MSNWLNGDPAFSPRLNVMIEDERLSARNLIAEIAERKASEEIFAASTLVLLDMPGRDTIREILALLTRHRLLQIVAGPFDEQTFSELCSELDRLSAENASETLPTQGADDQSIEISMPKSRRIKNLPKAALESHQAFVDLVAGLIRPGGMVLCDIELKPLSFSIPGQPPAEVRQRLRGAHAAAIACKEQGALFSVLSKLRFGAGGAGPEFGRVGVTLEYHLAFSKHKQERGITLAIDAISEHLASHFPWWLLTRSVDGHLQCHRTGPSDLNYCCKELDLLHWYDNRRAKPFQVGKKTTGRWFLDGAAGKAVRDLMNARLRIEPVRVTLSDIEGHIDEECSTNGYGLIDTIKDHLITTERKTVIPVAEQTGYSLGTGVSIGAIVIGDRRSKRRDIGVRMGVGIGK